MEGMKTCTKCKVPKALGEFSKDRSQKDGLQYKCKGCERDYRSKHKEKIFIYGKKYYSENKEQFAIWQRDYNLKNRDRITAQQKNYT